MLAVGQLVNIWTDLPEDIPDMETLAAAFAKVFLYKWENVMVGADYPLGWHLYWEGYLSVGRLSLLTDETTITSLRANPGEVTNFHNITLT